MILKVLFILSICFISSTAYGGTPMKAGQVLTEDSYVFKIDDAKKLLARVEILEQEEQELAKYKDLVKVYEDKESLYDERVKIKDEIIGQKDLLIAAGDKRITQLERYTKFRPLEDSGFALLGIGMTFGLMFAADAIDDQIQAPATVASPARAATQNDALFNISIPVIKVHF